MPGTHDLALFVVSGLLLNLTPGADTLFVVTRSVTHGTRAGVAAALGIGAGCCMHVLAAAAGVSAILAASSAAFTALTWLGAAYLVWVGVGLLRSRPAGPSAPPPAAASGRAVFVQGFLTNLLNPKVGLFFLAFVPQFIDADAPAKPLAFLFLGAIFVVNGTLWCLLVAWLAARAGARGAGHPAAAWLARGVGALFVGLGLRLALGDR